MDTSELIFVLLKNKGISQQGLAAAVGVTKYQVSEWKSGKTRSFMEHLPDIAKYLGVTTDYLLGNEQKNKPATERDKLINEIMQICEGLPKEKQLVLLNTARCMVEKEK